MSFGPVTKRRESDRETGSGVLEDAARSNTHRSSNKAEWPNSPSALPAEAVRLEGGC
jgi:hypothetical protein